MNGSYFENPDCLVPLEQAPESALNKFADKIQEISKHMSSSVGLTVALIALNARARAVIDTVE